MASKMYCSSVVWMLPFVLKNSMLLFKDLDVFTVISECYSHQQCSKTCDNSKIVITYLQAKGMSANRYFLFNGSKKTYRYRTCFIKHRNAIKQNLLLEKQFFGVHLQCSDVQLLLSINKFPLKDLFLTVLTISYQNLRSTSVGCQML